MLGYWETLQNLLAEGEPFVSVTLVDVVASAPANVGAKMLVTRDGLAHGSVGGGKIEAKAIAQAIGMLEKRRQPSSADEQRNWEGSRHAGAGAEPHTHFMTWNLQRDVGMTCGGEVRLFFEMYNVATWPIVIFGAGHCAQALVRLLLTMQCQVTVIDAREEWLNRLPRERSGKLKVIKAHHELRDHVKELPGNSFVVLMTMGHSSDQPILIEILKSRPGEFPYVGVIGSEAKAGALKRGLAAAGLTDDLAVPGKAYICPIGMAVGTNDPAEIAVSVAAQLLAVRDGVR